jgi:hypothetical protein
LRTPFVAPIFWYIGIFVSRNIIMSNSFSKLAFSIANRNSTVNQLADAETLKSSLGMAGMAGGYELSKLIDADNITPARRLSRLLFFKSLPVMGGGMGSDLGSSIVKSNLSNNAKAFIAAGGLAAGTAGLGRLGYDIYKWMR